MKEEHSSFYVTETDNILEMTRLVEQDRLMTERVSGLLPAGVSPDIIQRVLDLGCGPGGWVLDMAKAYPVMQVAGIDISEVMIAYATQRAIAEGVDNVQFRMMDFQQLDIPSSTYDLVNARFIQWFLTPQTRSSVLQEWFRVLRSGGILRLIEEEIVTMTNSRALDMIGHWFVSALMKAGRTVAPGGLFVGTPMLLRPALESLGCQDIQETAHHVNFSAGTRDHNVFSDNIIRGMETMAAFILKSRMVKKNQLAEAQEQVREDLQSPDFLGLVFFISAWGRKP